MQFGWLFVVFVLGRISHHVIGKATTILFTIIVALAFFAPFLGWVSYPVMNRQYGDAEIFTFLGYAILFATIIPGAISFYTIRSATRSGGKAFLGSVLIVVYANAAWIGFLFGQMVHNSSM